MKRPPKIFAYFLSQVVHPLDRESLSGDFEEMYSRVSTDKGRISGLFWYICHIIKLTPSFVTDSFYWSLAMFRNYMKIAFRNILKHKGFSSINIFGLALGMTCCILILLWVQDELSYDKFHENAGEIYRVVEHQQSGQGEIFPIAPTPWPLAAALKKDYSEVVNSTRFRNLGRSLIRYEEKSFYEDGFAGADPSFLEIFTFPLVKGDPGTALSNPNTVVITESKAKVYFGNEDPMGKTISRNNGMEFTVTGVARDVPNSSHVNFDFLVPFEPTLKELGWSDSWHNNSYYTYLLLQKNINIETFAENIEGYLARRDEGTITTFKLQQLKDIHLYSYFAIDYEGHSEDISVYVYVFSLVAIFILLIACINFMNLSTARSAKRAKEVGMRKVVGARRSDLIKQFYGESILLSVIALFISVISVYLLLPVFNNLTAKNLTLNFADNIPAVLGLIGITLVTGIIAGSYPALVQSSFQPVRVIKGSLGGNGARSAGSLFRKILVVTQFVLSIVLIIGTLIVYDQINFMLNKELGYEKDHMIYFRKRGELWDKYDAMKEEMLKNPNIINVTSCSDVPTFTLASFWGSRWEGMNEGDNLLLHHFSVDQDYIKTFKMEIVDGRDFSNEFTTDTSNVFILNESAVKAMNLEDPVGKNFRMWGMEGPIIGVVKDFHYKSLHEKIEPLVLRINVNRYIFARINSKNISETISSIENSYNRFNPEYPLEYNFLDESIGQLYRSEERTGTLFNYFTFLAIFISCLGLFGLVAYMAQQRTKEIGVRKVLGASIPNIVVLLSKEYLILVVLANIIAWPAAWYLMNMWLDSFASRTTIGPGLFILSGLLAVVIAVLTVSYQAVKAAGTNPTTALKYE